MIRCRVNDVPIPQQNLLYLNMFGGVVKFFVASYRKLLQWKLETWDLLKPIVSLMKRFDPLKALFDILVGVRCYFECIGFPFLGLWSGPIECPRFYDLESPRLIKPPTAETVPRQELLGIRYLPQKSGPTPERNVRTLFFCLLFITAPSC